MSKAPIFLNYSNFLYSKKNKNERKDFVLIGLFYSLKRIKRRNIVTKQEGDVANVDSDKKEKSFSLSCAKK